MPSTTTMKRSNQTNSHYHPCTESTSTKRRRINEEFQYTIATIQTALADAGRPPMKSIVNGRRERALPLLFGNNSVDSTEQGAKVMTSSEFDRLEEQEMLLASTQQEDDQQQQDENDPYGDVASMYMMASLVQSTRHYYSLATDSDNGEPTRSPSSYSSANSIKNVSSSNNSNTSSFKEDHDHASNDSMARAYSNYNNSYSCNTPSEDNSDGLSSWTPSSRRSLRRDYLNDNSRKNIDNDNRSDEQSSCDDDIIRNGHSSSSSTSSSSDSISSSEDRACSFSLSTCFPPQPKGQVKPPLGSIVNTASKEAFFVVG